MTFFLGIIVGLLIALVIFVVEIYLRPRNIGLKQVQKYIESKTQTKGAVFFPKSDAIRSAERKIQEDRERGEDTKIDDLQV